MNREEIERLYIMIDNLASGISGVGDRVSGLERIVTNGLSHRTQRIESKMDILDSKIDSILTKTYAVDKRLDGCLEKEEYIFDKKAEWDGRDRRHQDIIKAHKEWTARIIIGILLAIIGASVGYLI